MRPQQLRKRFLVGSGVAVLQLIMTQVVTFILAFSFSDVSETQQNQPVLFGLFLGVSFTIGIFLAGWLANRLGRLYQKPKVSALLAGTGLGTFLPLLLALSLYGKLEAGNPFFFVSIVAGILGFHAAGWVGDKGIPPHAKEEPQRSPGSMSAQEGEGAGATAFADEERMAAETDEFAKLHGIFRQAIQAEGLEHMADQLFRVASPAILLELLPEPEAGIPIGQSKIGGDPDLPGDFSWPEWRGKPMGFIGQINLSEANEHDIQGLLPEDGLLAFFYDLYEQPWGYDPKNQGYSHVAYFPPGIPLFRREVPDPEIRLRCSDVVLSACYSLPVFGSRDFDEFEAATSLDKNENTQYEKLVERLQKATRKMEGGSFHQLLGHAHNIQGDMQLEAELVTNGLYCGDLTGYEDPRREQLEPQAAEWQLLFQLDTDDSADLMWGDSGMIYYWIKRADLASRRFEKHWMDLQCF